MHRDEITERVARYADVVGAPVALGTDVERLSPLGDGRIPRHDDQGSAHGSAGRRGHGELPHATDPAASPRTSPAASPRSTAHDYRNEAALPAGAVLVVGSGQTGLQLAEELFAAGRLRVRRGRVRRPGAPSLSRAATSSAGSSS